MNSLNFGIVPETLMKFRMTAQLIRKTFFAPEIGEMRQKWGFFEGFFLVINFH